MDGLHSISVGQSHIDAVICGDFVNAGFVRDNEVACAARVYNSSAVGRWVEGGNQGVTRK